MKERGGGALMHVYVWEHIHVVSLPYRTNQWIFTKLGRDEVLMVPYNRDLYRSLLTSGVVFRPDPSRGGSGLGKNRSRGSLSSTNFFFRPEGYSNKPNA